MRRSVVLSMNALIRCRWVFLAMLLFAFGGSLRCQESRPAVIEVLARGVGTSVSEATQDAARSAVESAMGGVVSVQSRLDNGELFEKIVMATAGSLQTLEVVEQVELDGLVRVKIRALVARNLILSKAAEFRESVSSADGKSLAAQLRSRRESREGAAEILTEILGDWPLKLLRPEAIGEPVLIGAAGSEVYVGARVAVHIEHAAWAGMRDAVNEVLKAVATKSVETRRIFRRPRPYPSANGLLSEIMSDYEVAMSKFAEAYSFEETGYRHLNWDPNSPGAGPTVLQVDVEAGRSMVAVFDSPGSASAAMVYDVPSATVRAILEAGWGLDVSLAVSLEDVRGAILAETELHICPNLVNTSYLAGGLQFTPTVKDEGGQMWLKANSPAPNLNPSWGRVALIDPAISFDSWRLMVESLELPVALKVSEEALDKVSAVRARLRVEAHK